MPKIPEAEETRRKKLKYGVNQKNYYDKHHRVKDLQELKPGQVVWITDKISYGRIKAKHAAPRSYLVETPKCIIRRNRFHLRHLLGSWNMIKMVQRENCQISQETPHLSHFQMICQELQAYPALLQQRRQHLVHRGLLNSFIEQGVVGQYEIQTDLIYN
ncbi:hypothetical protein AVEN_2059-1 [Araneus ventricosus]|uniref:Uncharacterized protein n=1 Tax=Araneus ventricosus TaxID=182803 RepID=A0A4Y2MER2_ARAVE|nr:hypothetical protein AVEN_2059-1 [Araneus ventricosus]